MRKINKGQRPEILDTFLRRNSNADWKTLHNEPNKPTFQEMRLTILVEEQDNKCAYTELPISEVKDAHIDHYKVRSQFSNLIFDWENLLCSCNSNGNEYGAMHKDSKFEIGSKLNTYNEIFNPVIDEVENYFYYNQSGEIESKSNECKPKVEKTVEVFNLNHPTLKNQREVILSEINIYIEQEIPKKAIEQIYQNRGFLSVVRQALL